MIEASMESTADKNKAENEVVFRNFNEQMNAGIRELKKIAKEEKQYTYVPNLKKPVQFCCECADENCRERIQISPNMYTKLHSKHNAFVIIPGHAVEKIEKIVLRRLHYQVVEKFIAPPENVDSLHITNLTIKKL